MQPIRPVKKNSASLIIRQELIKMIQTDYFSDGLLPSEESLGIMFGVSRITVRDALAYLENLGYITRVQGRGTVINRTVSSLTGRVSQGMPFMEFIRSQGFTPSVIGGKVIKVPIEEDLKKKLRTNSTEMYKVEKVFCGNEEPFIFCINHFPTDYINDNIFNYRMDETVVFRVLQEHFNFPQIAHDIVNICPVAASEYVAKHLNLEPGTAILSFEVVSMDNYQRPVLVNREYYHPEKMHFCEVRSVEYNFG